MTHATSTVVIVDTGNECGMFIGVRERILKHIYFNQFQILANTAYNPQHILRIRGSESVSSLPYF